MSNSVCIIFSRKKNRAHALFIISQKTELVLVSSSVVAKANLLNQHIGVRSSLINQRTVATPELGHANISIFCIPLIDSGTVLEAGLFQADSTVISTLANNSSVTTPVLCDGDI